MRRPADGTEPLSLLPLYPTQFFAGVVLIALGPMLNAVLTDLRIPLAQAGLLSLGFFLGRVLGVLLLNFVFAQVPVKWTLVGAASLQAISLAASGLLARGLWSLFGMYLVVGLAAVIPSVIPGMWVGSHVKQGTQRAMLLILLFFALGVLVAPIVIGLLLGLGVTWRWIMVGEALFSAVMALVLMAMPLANIPGAENLRLRHLREVMSFAPRFLAVILVATFLYVGAESTMNVWLAKFEADSFAASATSAALAVTFFWAGIMLGRFAAIPLARRFDSSRLLALFAALFAAFALGVGGSPTLVLSQLCSFLAGLGASACFPLIAGYTSRFPRWHSGVVYSAMVIAGTTGSMVFPYVTGPLAAAFGFPFAICFAAVPALMVMTLAFYLHRLAADQLGVSPRAGAAKEALDS